MQDFPYIMFTWNNLEGYSGTKLYQLSIILPSFWYFNSCRFKLHFARMRSGEHLPLHKMKWGLGWATSTKQFGRVSQSSCVVSTQHWRILGLTNVFPIMPHLFNFLLGWVAIVMVWPFFMSMTYVKIVWCSEKKKSRKAWKRIYWVLYSHRVILLL